MELTRRHHSSGAAVYRATAAPVIHPAPTKPQPDRGTAAPTYRYVGYIPGHGVSDGKNVFI